MLIAEIGNCHFGDFNKAKLLIRMAHENGADLIKGQAFKAKDIKSGSMPKEFYEMCEFSVDYYTELIDYARSIGNDMFFSIFSNGFDVLEKKQYWHKITGSQTKDGAATLDKDLDTYIISTPSKDYIPRFNKASVLYVSEYCTAEPNLVEISRLFDYLWRPVGYSDHCLGMHHCLRAKRIFGANVIEKHLCLINNVEFRGTVFRDTIHGITPSEFGKLARELSK